ncbi:MAG TPA: ROK family transcriptional regulator [Candidatus Blautia gallistercoris]|uniref:ROK family transcriptional regulator n=1 Tax=Candidatus Blautia gallistercoris TaxID=2838490 RepID=A0A9D1WJV2_9FIRM|nr:ROK family transcriptional regulator [Candidatus Blautia gallistercoris]
MSKSRSTADIKAQNRQLIYHFVRDNEPVSKQDIVVRLELSLPTVTQNLQYLEKQNLLKKSKSKINTGGRSAAAYSYRKKAKMALGVYITGNHLTAVCVDLSGNVIFSRRTRIKFDLNNDAYLHKIGELVEEIKEEVHLASDRLLGVGVAVPSLVSDDGERVIYGLTHNFTGKTRAEITKYIPYRTKMFHDSYVAGFAEVWSRRSVRNAVYINLNNTIGGSIIIDNHIYSGDNNRSGEIGHMIIHPASQTKCYCGQTGCLETVCNAGILDSHTDGNLAEFFRLLDSGTPAIMEVWDQYLENLALAIHNTRMLLDAPIILGGYVGAHMEEHMEELYAKVDQKDCFGDSSRDYVFPCKYKIEATAAGAALQLVDEFLKSI